MDYLTFADQIDPERDYEIYFLKDKPAYEIYSTFVFGKLILPKLTEASPELISKYILVKIEATKQQNVNEKLNNDQLERLRTHGVLYHNIDFDRTLGIS